MLLLYCVALRLAPVRDQLVVPEHHYERDMEGGFVCYLWVHGWSRAAVGCT